MERRLLLGREEMLNYLREKKRRALPSTSKRVSTLLIEPPKGKMLKTFGDRSFQAAAPYLWNRLPHEIRMIKCLDKFKKAIKTFLFNEAFCNH